MDYMTISDMSDNAKMWSWFRDHPDGSMTECARQLEYFIKGDRSRPYYIKVGRAITWMVREGYMRHTICPLRGKIIKTIKPPVEAKKSVVPIDNTDLVNRVRDALKSGKTLAEIARSENWITNRGDPDINRAWRVKKLVISSDNPDCYMLHEKQLWTVRDALGVIYEMLNLIPDEARRISAKDRTKRKEA